MSRAEADYIQSITVRSKGGEGRMVAACGYAVMELGGFWRSHPAVDFLEETMDGFQMSVRFPAMGR